MSLFKANRSASLATPIGSVFMPASGTDTAGASTRITNPIQSRLTACGGSIRETPQEAETGPQGPIKQMGALFKVKLELFNGNPLGWWHPKGDHPLRGDPAIADALARVTRPLYLVRDESGLAVATGGCVTIPADENFPAGEGAPLIAYAPALHPRQLGDAHFKATHQLRYAYLCGAMANGITSVEMVRAAGRAGMLGFFGAAGLAPRQVEAAIDQIQGDPDDYPYGFNLIHSPHEPELENEIVRLYLRRGIQLVSASAFLGMTPQLILYRVKGIHTDPQGRVVPPQRVIAKVSREEVARQFLSPPPDKHLAYLREKGLISETEARLARQIPVADALSAEADSGGHTDNRPALSLLPTLLCLRDEMMAKHGYQTPIAVGLGGGIATPEATAAAFALGAAYVLSGSINQSCVEADTSLTVRQMLCQARQADVVMAPAADMFEMGVKVQVLKRGTMFSMRAARLYELYRAYDCYDEIPAEQRQMVEGTLLRRSFEAEWQATRAFFAQRDPRQIELAENNPKHKMALVFRSYLGQSSRWAKTGLADRVMDYQIWCGPSMGAFNEWVRNSYLAAVENRRTVAVAMNLMYGAAVVTRFNWLRLQGAGLSPLAGRFRPLALEEIQRRLE
jgi:trans-AT polyketide synthase/acyltransferase/oxidoreductase domain-containing protein